MEKEEEQNLILKFIEVYRSLPALWDIRSKDYANRDIKNSQYSTLLSKYKEFYPDGEKAAVVKKINSLRTAYRSYRKKVSDLERSGVGYDEESVPSLFYADALNFLSDMDKPRESRTSMATPITLGEKDEVPKKKKPQDSCDALIDIASQKLLTPSDDQAKMAEVYAAKLRKMTTEQQIFADRFINDILYEGQMGRLNEEFLNMGRSRSSTPGQLGPLHEDSIFLRRSRASTPYSQFSPITADNETHFTFTSAENVNIPMSQRSGIGNSVQSSGKRYAYLPLQRSQAQHAGDIEDNIQETAAAYFMNFSES